MSLCDITLRLSRRQRDVRRFEIVALGGSPTKAEQTQRPKCE